MSGVVGWLKSNIFIVVFAVLIIALPVGGFVGSSMWNKKIKTKAEEELSSKKRLVDGVSRVTYTLPPIAEGETPIEEARTPNAAVTRFFLEQREARQAEIEEVVTRAVRFNKTADRAVLEPGLLPELEDSREARRRVRDLGERIVGTEEQPSLFAGLFRGINAGEPAPEPEVARRVVDAYRAEIDRAGGDLNDLTAEEQEALNERMKGVRYGVYARRAEEISVFASVEALKVPGEDGESVIPVEAPASPDETDVLRWQMNYWLVEDLLRAVDLANRTSDGLPTEVPRSPVKRIVSITVDGLEMPEKPEEDASAGSSSAGANNPFGTGGGNPMMNNRGMMPGGGMAGMGGMTGMGGGGGGDPVATHTGRSADDQNGVFLVRNATITVVASSDDLVRVLESFGAANFMTVTSVNLSEIDRWADLKQGFYYGPDHVVRAEIGVEAAYLHFWLADVVPDFIASAWGIEKPMEDETATP